MAVHLTATAVLAVNATAIKWIFQYLCRKSCLWWSSFAASNGVQWPLLGPSL